MEWGKARVLLGFPGEAGGVVAVQVNDEE